MLPTPSSFFSFPFPLLPSSPFPGHQGNGEGQGIVTVIPATLVLYTLCFPPSLHETSRVPHGPNSVAFDKPHHLQLSSDLARLQSDK